MTYIPVTKDSFAGVSGGDDSNLAWGKDSLTVKGASMVSFNLPKELPMDTTVVASIKGKSDGNFRVWLLDSGEVTSSNQVNMQSEFAYVGGEFEFLVEMTVQYVDNNIADNLARKLAFKAPSWDSKLDGLVIEEIGIYYGTLRDYKKALKGDDDTKPVNNGKKTKEVAVWGSAMLRAGNDHLPKNVKLAGSTVRQQIRMTLGGETLKLCISNEYGEKDLFIDALYVADLISPSKSDIDTSTTVQITYNGKKQIVVPKGQSIYTDAIDFEFEAGQDLAVTMELGNTVPNTVTSHTASRCSTWVEAGDHGKEKSVKGDTTTSWYFIRLATTMATEDTGVIICFGDSLTDGASVSTNAFARWPDELAKELRDNGYDNYAVVNMGIGATLLTWEINRVQRDVIDVPGAEKLIMMYGINDIANTKNDKSGEMINLYKRVASQCHNNDIEIYGMTMTPTKGASGGYYSDMVDLTRKNINKWVLSDNGSFDGAFDSAAFMADPNDPDKIKREYVSVWNDWLHFNDAGYKNLGKFIYRELTQYLD